MDRIHIRGLLLRCLIGVDDEEQHEKQDVVIDITLEADLSRACATDRLEDTVDYRDLKKRVIAMVERSSFSLVERLAEEIARVCLADPAVKRCRVSVEKPGALRFARSVAVEIVRDGTDHA